MGQWAWGGGGVTLMGRRFLGLPKDCLFSSVTGGMGAFEVARPGRSVVHLNVKSIAHPLPPTYVRTVRGTMRRLTRTRAFRKCNPRRKCSFLVRTIVGGSCTTQKVRFSGSRMFVDSKTGDSAKGVKSVLHRSGDMKIASPVCPMCVSDGIVYKHTNMLRRSDNG